MKYHVPACLLQSDGSQREKEVVFPLARSSVQSQAKYYVKKSLQDVGPYERRMTHLLRSILRLKIKFKITALRTKENSRSPLIFKTLLGTPEHKIY